MAEGGAAEALLRGLGGALGAAGGAGPGAPGAAGGALEVARLGLLRLSGEGGAAGGAGLEAARRALQHLWQGDYAGAQKALEAYPAGDPGADAARDLRRVLRERALDAVGRAYDVIRLDEVERLLGGGAGHGR